MKELKELIQNNADPQIIEQILETYLASFEKENFIKMADYLVLDATSLNNISVVKLLLKYDVKFEVYQPYMEYCLHIAARKNYKEIIELLIQKSLPNKKIINIRDYNSETPLHVAVEYENIEIIEMLIKYGAKIDKVCRNGYSPFYTALRNRNIEIMEILIGYGADINKIDIKKRNFLYIAAKYGHLNIVKFLIDQGIDINAKNSRGFTPLLIATMNFHTEIVKILLDHGVTYPNLDRKFITDKIISDAGRDYFMKEKSLLNEAKINFMKDINHLTELATKFFQNTKTAFSFSVIQTLNKKSEEKRKNCIEKLKRDLDKNYERMNFDIKEKYIKIKLNFETYGIFLDSELTELDLNIDETREVFRTLEQNFIIEFDFTSELNEFHYTTSKTENAVPGIYKRTIETISDEPLQKKQKNDTNINSCINNNNNIKNEEELMSNSNSITAPSTSPIIKKETDEKQH